MSADFHHTRMGQRFYNQNVPELVRQVKRLADAIERLVEVTEESKDGERSALLGPPPEDS